MLEGLYKIYGKYKKWSMLEMFLKKYEKYKNVKILCLLAKLVKMWIEKCLEFISINYEICMRRRNWGLLCKNNIREVYKAKKSERLFVNHCKDKGVLCKFALESS